MFSNLWTGKTVVDYLKTGTLSISHRTLQTIVYKSVTAVTLLNKFIYNIKINIFMWC
jgi:hypothetical protein